MTEVIRIPKTGDVIGGKYQLQEEIGRGGFGIVFRSRQLGVERTVAVKMLLPHAITHEGRHGALQAGGAAGQPAAARQLGADL
jgi:hypothetical protein